MKAYRLYIKDFEEAGMEVVFAENVREAKKKVGELSALLEEYIYLRAVRDKRYDGMENLSSAELACRQWRDGWRWEESDIPDVEEASDTDFIDWYKKTFEWQSAEVNHL